MKKGEIYPVQRTLTSGPITSSILLGLCMGSGAAISMQYGSGEYDKMRQSVFQSFALIGGHGAGGRHRHWLLSGET